MAYHFPKQNTRLGWPKKTLDSIPLEHIDFFALSNLSQHFSHPNLTLKELSSPYKHYQTYDVFEGEQYKARLELRYGHGSRAACEEEYLHALEVQLAVWSEDEKLSHFLLGEIPRIATKVDTPYSYAERRVNPIVATMIRGAHYG